MRSRRITIEVYADTNRNGEFDKDDELLGEMTELDGGIYQMKELRYGNYFVREKTAPTGFVLDERVYMVSIAEVKKPEHALKLFIRFALAKGVVTYGLELMMALFQIVQGVISTIMNAAGFGSASQTVLPQEIVTAVEDCGFFESIPLWAVTLIGGLFITVLSFIMIMSVYGRFFKLYLYTAIAPVPLSSFAGEPSQSVGKSFIKSYAAVCLKGAIIVLACIIFSVFAASPPVVNPDAAAVSMVWSYIRELVFNMLVLVGAVKMADRVVREMMGL